MKKSTHRFHHETFSNETIFHPNSSQFLSIENNHFFLSFHQSKANFKNIMLSFLFVFLASSKTYDFITSEIPQLYTFSCSENVTFRYMPLSKYKLIIRSSLEDISCSTVDLLDAQFTKNLNLNLQKSNDYFESQSLELDNEPLLVTCKCNSQESQSCAISPIVVQSVTSSTGILIMGIFALVMIGIDIGIISVQFCTFHHRKLD